MHENILDTIGNTPLVRLNKINSNIFAKIEAFNPGGSVKDRIALAMIEDAERKSLIEPGDTVIEPTSGNTGIGLAMVAAVKGYKLILTMPASMSVERRKLLRAYGAEIILTPSSEGMKGAVERAEELAKQKGYFQLQQFTNEANPEIHRRTTALEILDEIEKVDFFVAGVGTGGTLTGVGEVLKQQNEETKIIAVEPDDSAVLSGCKPGRHGIQGIGAGFVPEIFNREICDKIIRVTMEEAYAASRLLAAKEGILTGISSGANLHAAILVSKEHPRENVVTIFPDTGERYLSTSLFEEK